MIRVPWALRSVAFAALAVRLLALASTAGAQEAPTSVPVLGAVQQGAACPTASTLGAPDLPIFHQGDLASICFGQQLPQPSTIQVKVGEKPAQVGQQSASGVLFSLPDQSSPGAYVVSGTVGTSQFTPFLIQYYPTPKPLVTGVSPAMTVPDKPIRINGQGFAAPKKEVQVWFGDDAAVINEVAADGTWVIATLPKASASGGGPKPVEVRVWNVVADQPQGQVSETFLESLGTADTWKTIGIALLPVLLVAIFVAWLYWSQRQRPKTWLRGLVAALLLDESTQTYSLSRAQFYWWLIIIAFAYAFLFVARGLTFGRWEFPPFNGLIGTLGISTLTVLGAIAVSGMKGQKGSGALHPAPSDLIMHGGIIAPERVQQVLWTVLAGAAVLWIVVSTYATQSALPDIPQELLILMGLSSAAYVGGKIVRAPGPNIRQVDRDPKSKPDATELLVSGDNLDRNAVVTLDGALLPKSAIKVDLDTSAGVTGRDAADASQDLVSNLRLTTGISGEDWDKQQPHTLDIVNSDGQRSEWRTPTKATAPVASVPVEPAPAQPAAAAQEPAAPAPQVPLAPEPETLEPAPVNGTPAA